MRGQEHQLNQDAYARLKDFIKDKYPYGQFVGLVGGEIVADADDFETLHAKLRAAGKDPFQAFIIQAGHEYLENAIIF